MSDGVDQWLVVGSRRWARIVARELCHLLPPDRSLHLQASPGDTGLREWWDGSPLKERIELVERPVPCDGTGVALVVDSAHEHRTSVASVLDAGYHAVCEKPLTFSRADSLRLLDHAAGRGLKLFCTNTYLFADYLHVFRRDWLRDRTFSELELTWADATAEVRHGEAKSYDSSVPVIVDVLPHVACIVVATHGPWTFDRASVAVARGGSAVTTEFEGDDLAVRARLSRNAERRVRTLRFSGPAGDVTLDFDPEPGVVSPPGVSADPTWDAKRKPIGQMLESVRTYFATGVLDERLGPEAALLGNDLIDAVAEGYVQQQIDGSRSEYAAKEADAIRRRGLPHLPQASPLRRLAEFNQPGKVFT